MSNVIYKINGKTIQEICFARLFNFPFVTDLTYYLDLKGLPTEQYREYLNLLTNSLDFVNPYIDVEYILLNKQWVGSKDMPGGLMLIILTLLRIMDEQPDFIPSLLSIKRKHPNGTLIYYLKLLSFKYTATAHYICTDRASVNSKFTLKLSPQASNNGLKSIVWNSFHDDMNHSSGIKMTIHKFLMGN